MINIVSHIVLFLHLQLLYSLTVEETNENRVYIVGESHGNLTDVETFKVAADAIKQKHYNTTVNVYFELLRKGEIDSENIGNDQWAVDCGLANNYYTDLAEEKLTQGFRTHGLEGKNERATAGASRWRTVKMRTMENVETAWARYITKTLTQQLTTSYGVVLLGKEHIQKLLLGLTSLGINAAIWDNNTILG